MNERYQIHTGSAAIDENIVRYGRFRFTILTEEMVRVEYNNEESYIDLPTQIIWFRHFSKVDYSISKGTDKLYVETKELMLVCTKGGQEIDSLSIQRKNSVTDQELIWHYGDSISNLKGTTRTLDTIDGAIELEDGILSKDGVAILDDSTSYLIEPLGEVKAREREGLDFYFLGYGRDYKKCLRDYFRLTGAPPMLPKYALGNWWSRFFRYTEKTYMELVEKFEEQKIPIAVAMVDMDWHITNIDSKYGSGWTGYTWNRELFPDPKRFLTWLHHKNLIISLNVHPADGIRGFEEAYPKIAKVLQKEQNINIEREEPVVFDSASPTFLEAYFKYVHEPHELRGVDFWWIDWQQGEESKLPGLDPLWILNHYHFLDNQKQGDRALILSRYGGPGSHRYPVGFSGDIIISWKSLAFQPYFTANASNIGYGWWSNDIGGHMLGYHDEELQVRWVQFGVFSPINRLHCSADRFNHKEPWNYSIEANVVITNYLQFRHRFIPYLYTMNQHFAQEGIPLLRPMYYEYPWEQGAYEVNNEYFFGSEMICCPITTPINQETGQASVEGWLPEGTYIDLFTGIIYDGKRKVKFHRGISDVPVLLKAGAIVPFDNTTEFNNKIGNPFELEIVIAAGKNGSFALYEDDGVSLEYQDGNYAITKFELDYLDQGEFIIRGAQGNYILLPSKRQYKLRFMGFAKPEGITIIKAGKEEKAEYMYNYKKNEVILDVAITPAEEITVSFTGGMEEGKNNVEELSFPLLDKARIEYKKKDAIFEVIQKYKGNAGVKELLKIEMSDGLRSALTEILLAQRIEEVS